MEGGPETVESGEFAGWRRWTEDAFESATGPFHFRIEESGDVHCAFRAEARHMNGSGALHGGCALAFADFCLFAITEPHRTRTADKSPMVTVSLNGDFVGPAFAGDMIEGRGELVRAGGSLWFARGLITTAGRPVMSFSGVIKRLRPPA